jgi:hypothetical protein
MSNLIILLHFLWSLTLHPTSHYAKQYLPNPFLALAFVWGKFLDISQLIDRAVCMCLKFLFSYRGMEIFRVWVVSQFPKGMHSKGSLFFQEAASPWLDMAHTIYFCLSKDSLRS